MDEILPVSGSVEVNVYIACAYMKTVIVKSCAMWGPLHIPSNLMNKGWETDRAYSLSLLIKGT